MRIWLYGWPICSLLRVSAHGFTGKRVVSEVSSSAFSVAPLLSSQHDSKGFSITTH